MLQKGTQGAVENNLKATFFENIRAQTDSTGTQAVKPPCLPGSCPYIPLFVLAWGGGWKFLSNRVDARIEQYNQLLRASFWKRIRQHSKIVLSAKLHEALRGYRTLCEHRSQTVCESACNKVQSGIASVSTDSFSGTHSIHETP
jgi:hypothetical protein